MTGTPTPSQTAGPYVEIGTAWNADGRVVSPGTEGAITLSGTVSDGATKPVTDALVEFFQADPAGRFGGEAEHDWTGFARALTVSGGYEVTTLKPGPVELPGGRREAPHVDVSIFARGLQQRVVTRMYFEDEAEANAEDRVLASLDETRRSRLLARAVPGGYRFDVVLQGEEETPFFVP